MKELDSKSLAIAIEYIESWLDFNFKNSRVPGMQVAIQHEDKILLSKSYGYADSKAKTELTNKHAFRIASHSKTFTATAIMQLKESGKLNLDDPISKHVSWFKSSKDQRVEQVTIRQLVNHSAGLTRDGDDSNYWQLTRPFPDQVELREYISQSKLVYDSDEQFKYSNYGFGYLGFVIEAVSGVPYNEYVKSHIVTKLNLKTTGPEYNPSVLNAAGYGLRIFNREPKQFKHADTKSLSPATGFYSTAEDACTYFSAHFLGDNMLLNDASKRAMQHGYWIGNESESYGIGMSDYKKDGWHLYGHSGGFPGFISQTQFDAKKKLVVSVLTNCNDSPASLVSKSIIGIIDKFQQDSGFATATSKKLAKYTGRYFSTWGPVDIISTGSKIYAIHPASWSEFKGADELEIIDEQTLRIEKTSNYACPGETIEFVFDSKSTAKEIKYAGRRMLKWDNALKENLF